MRIVLDIKYKGAPGFLIAGGVATGTSFLSALLAKHPEVYLPKVQRPEPNFFHYTHKYRKGLTWYLETWFGEVGHEKVFGERSSLLLPSENAASRIHSHFPEMKLIFCLRNPVERAWANYRFTVLEGLETLAFEEALKQEKRRTAETEGEWREIRPHAYLQRSIYSEGLREYFSLFPRENILLIKSEEMGKNPSKTLQSVCQFLSVDSSVQLEPPPNYSSPSVVNAAEQKALREHFGPKFPLLVEAIRKEEPLDAFGPTPRDRAMVDRLKKNLHHKKEAMSPAARTFLQSALKEEIQNLRPLLEFEIHDWQ